MLLFCDSFDHWAIADITQKYDRSLYSSGITIGAYGRFGTSGLQRTNGQLEYWKVLPAQKSTLIIGMALSLRNYNNSATPIGLWCLRSLTSALECAAYVSPSGELYVTGSGSSACASMRLKAYDYYEWKLVVNSGAGSVILHRNGVEILNQSGINTSAAGSNLAAIFGLGYFNGLAAMPALWYDDLYLADTSGSECNDLLGDVRVEKLLPGGAGSYSQWTPSAGGNYQCVDEATPSDADYVSAAASGLKDTYALSNSASTSGSPKAVVVHPRLSKAGGGFRGVKALLRSGGTDQLAATEHRPGTGFRPHLHPAVFTLDPATGTPWANVAAINALEAGMEVTT